MYIYQVERALLYRQIVKFSHFLSGDIIDVGGGERSRYKQLFTYRTYTSLDISSGPDVDIVASADDIPLPSLSKDAVLSTQMLEHVKYPEKCVQEMFRILRAGGNAVITVPQWNELHAEPTDFWRYTNFGIKELFERNGFVTIASEQRGGFFSTMIQMLLRYITDKYHLYEHPILGKVSSRIFQLIGCFAIFLDHFDRSRANRKHAIGWCFVFRKM